MDGLIDAMTFRARNIKQATSVSVIDLAFSGESDLVQRLVRGAEKVKLRVTRRSDVGEMVTFSTAGEDDDHF